MLSSRPIQDQPSLPAFPTTAFTAENPSNMTQQSESFQLCQSFENKLFLDHHTTKPDSKQNSTLAGKTACQKSEGPREFGRELTNENIQQPFAANGKSSSKQLLTLVQIGSTADSKIGPNKQTQSHVQPPCKFIDSDTKQSLSNEDSLFKTQKLNFPSSIVEENSLDGQTTKDSSDLIEKSRLSEPVSINFKERLQAYKKKISNEMTFQDQLDMRDPQQVSEFVGDIFANLRKQEMGQQLQPDYLSKVQLPTEVKDTSRAFLVEWIIDVHRKFRLMPETLYITVYLIDRFLSLQQIKKSQLHILGVTSLLIATKYEEIYPPELKDLLQVSENKFSRAEVLQMELDMLTVLQFQIYTPTAYRFLERFKKIALTTAIRTQLSVSSDQAPANDDQVFFFAQYIQEIALLDASLLKYRPSELAAASLILSCKGLKSQTSPWSKEVEKITGMQEDDLEVVVEDVRGFVVEVNPKFLTTLKYKFSKAEYQEVAALPFKF